MSGPDGEFAGDPPGDLYLVEYRQGARLEDDELSRAERLVESDDDDYAPKWTPDGQVVFLSRQGDRVIVRCVPPRGASRLLLDEPDVTGAWPLPDGGLLFSRNGQGRSTLWLLPATSGPRRALDLGGLDVLDMAPHPDARTLYLTPQGGGPLHRFDLVTGHIEIAAPGTFKHPRVSPDGAHLAFVSEGAVRVLDLSSGLIRTVSTPDPDLPGLTAPGFSPDGSRIFYTAFTYDEEFLRGSAWVVSSEGGPARPLDLGPLLGAEPLRVAPGHTAE